MIVSQEILKKELCEIGFTLWELHLYIDANPNDAAALAEYNMCTNKHRAAIEHYEKLYGLIDPVDNKDRESWEWIKDPWPSEGSGD